MQHVNAIEWKFDKQVAQALTPRCLVEIKLAAGAAVEITAEDPDGELHSLGTYISRESTKHKFRLDGYVQLHLNAESEFGYQVVVRELAQTEKLNNDPPPQPIPETNILQRIRQRAAQEAGVLRENFLENDTGLQGYEISDEDDGAFEEQKLAKLQADKKRLAERRKKDRDRDARVQPTSAKPDSVRDGDDSKPAVQEPVPDGNKD